MIRMLHGEDRSEAGAFTPIPRARLVGRLAASASHPITLLVAPAGYGKSVIIRQYLTTLSDATVRFALRAHHASLLGFLRGLGDAFGDLAPHLGTMLAGAYERNTDSSNRSADLAVWMLAHLESFAGVVAIDDLHVAENDLEVARFVSSLIERTKGKIRWILASRSTAGLPLGTWMAYRDMDFPIDEHELRFTLDEAREAADRIGLAIRDDELAELVALTEGWPAAISFALRSSTRSSELRNISALTREMIYRLLAEQVYARLDDEQRSLLEVAVALPVIEVEVLERAGFDRALTIVERLCERTAFIHEESPGVYQCHDLFREFLRHQTALGGKRLQHEVHERAARALEQSGDFEYAITSYATAGLTSDVLRLLEKHGFDLLERARGDVVARAIEVLDERTRGENAAILALQGILQSTAGKFSRAESLLRRALSRAGNNRDLVARASLRLASLIGNQGKDVGPVLYSVAHDNEQKASYRALALSIIAARQAIAGDTKTAAASIAGIERLLPALDFNATRARVLHHLGIMDRHLGNPRSAMARLTEASELAMDLRTFWIASRTYAVLSNLALYEYDDVDRQLEYASMAASSARKAGDSFALRTALLQTLSGHMRNANVEAGLAIEQQLLALRLDELAVRYLEAFRALRLAWDSRFGEAHGLLRESWRELPAGVDRVVSGAQDALFRALDGDREGSIELVSEVMTLLQATSASGRFEVRSLMIARAFCAVAELANGRATVSERMLRRGLGVSPVERAVLKAASSMVHATRTGDWNVWEDVISVTGYLADSGYADVGRLLAAAAKELRCRKTAVRPLMSLTASEREVLRLSADGFAPKEIADQTARSVHTVRAHLANAIFKLECHGTLEAVQAAHQQGFI